jgi:hypothetical protein
MESKWRGPREEERTKSGRGRMSVRCGRFALPSFDLHLHRHRHCRSYSCSFPPPRGPLSLLSTSSPRIAESHSTSHSHSHSPPSSSTSYAYETLSPHQRDQISLYVHALLQWNQVPLSLSLASPHGSGSHFLCYLS